jgi:hypothetical protein
MYRITTLAAGLLALSFASGAVAGESALVGRLKQDGTIQVYKDRFLQAFPDGTAVATIEATPAAGGPRLTRASTDGCRAETTVLVVAAAPAPDGSRPLWAVDWHPIVARRCYDDGCKAEFDHLPWDAGCMVDASLGCVCRRTNTDQVIFETGGYCRPFQVNVPAWDLDDWFHPQFIQ